MPTSSSHSTKAAGSRGASTRSAAARGTASRRAAGAGSAANAAARVDLAEALADLPPRVRVHELARRAGLNSKDMIAALADSGVAVGSASSAVDRDVAEEFLTTLLGAGAAPVGDAAAGDEAGTAKETTSAAPARAPRRTRAAKAAASGEDAAAAEPVGEAAGDAAPRSSRRGRGAKSAEPAARSGGRSTAKAAAAHAQGDTADAGPDADAEATVGAPAVVIADTPADAASEVADQTPSRRGRRRGAPQAAERDAAATTEPADAETAAAGPGEDADDEQSDRDGSRGRRRRRGGRGRRSGRAARPDGADAEAGDAAGAEAEATEAHPEQDVDTSGAARRSRRRRGAAAGDDSAEVEGDVTSAEETDDDEGAEDDGSGSRRRRRRRHRRSGSSDAEGDAQGDAHEGSGRHGGSSGVQGVRGSTRLEAKRQRRRDSRETRRRPQILSEAEFLARREAVDRVMAVRQRGDLAQVALLEDGVLVEHFVSEHGNASMIGNIYLGRVQNVLPSMEAAFVDIGKGRNAVLYAGEVNWDIAGLEGKERRIETALSGGDTVLVQVSKDPIGHKGARLTTQISLPGRFLVFVPGGGATGISRKLPDNERKRLKKILDAIVPADAGVIIRTAAEGVGEEDLAADVERLKAQWQEISEAARKGTDAGSAPKQLYTEPDTLIKVVRDLFNSDINRLLIDGDRAWSSLSEYVLSVAPELADRVSRYIGDRDVFDAFRIDEQIAKALQRKVRLPSGGSLVIDRTEAMTVIDVNTGKFTGSGGNLEETVTRNNLEAAEEIVRQLRLRDIGGIIVVDFIDMVLESNRDLVLRRLTECLGRDRTRHQVAEVTSLGLVQMTRKRMGLGLVEAFSEPCATCNGRGIVLHDTPSDSALDELDNEALSSRSRKGGRKRGRHHEDDAAKFEPLVVERVLTDAKPDPRGPKPPVLFRADIGTAGEPVDGAVGPVDGIAELVEAAAESVDGAPGGAVEPGAEAAPAPATEASAEIAEIPEVPVEAAEAPAAPAKTPRRRRAAGRPAGAPAKAAESLDMVLPAMGAVPAEAPVAEGV